MERFVLFKNSKVVGSYDSVRVARFNFLRVCSSCNFQRDYVVLVDIDADGETIASY